MYTCIWARGKGAWLIAFKEHASTERGCMHACWGPVEGRKLGEGGLPLHAGLQLLLGQLQGCQMAGLGCCASPGSVLQLQRSALCNVGSPHGDFQALYS